MKNTDVVALGELLIDFTENGKSAQGNPIMEANPGGAPCNVLSMLTKLGASTAFIGKVGDDMFGRQLSDALVEVGIETKGLKTDHTVNTTLAFVHTYPNGDRDFSFYRNPGADMMLSVEDLDKELIGGAKIFHYGSLSMTDERCFEATKEAIRIAKGSDAILSFDPNLRPPLWGGDMELAKARIAYGMEQCDVLKISDNEIVWFTGKDSYDEGVRVLKDRFSNLKLILVSMGEEGSMAFLGEKRVVVGPFLNPNTIETTGAGDTFMGCVLDYVLRHPKLDYDESQLTQMLTFANAAASIITTKKGALRVMPTKEEIEDLLANMG